MKTYKSKVGLELAIPLAGLLVAIGCLMIVKGLWAGAGIILFVSLSIAHLFLTTHYKLDEYTLKIQSGFFFRKELPYTSIRKIIETRNPISSPALSLDRIEIVYNRFDSVLISPEDKMNFIAELLHRKPDIEVQLKSKA
ncbi:PH domain-containing protein [Spirosoma gilvum]